MWNIRIRETFTCIGIRKTLETLTTLGSSGTKLLLPSWLIGFQHKERDSILTMLTVPSDPTTHGSSRRPNWTGLAKAPKINSLRPASNLNKLFFFSKITPNPQPIASGPDVIHIPSLISYPGFLLWHLRFSHPPRTCVNTCIDVCTYPCTKPNSSKPNQTER